MTTQLVGSCIRCGVDRIVRWGRSGLCRDCSTLLSKKDRKEWA